MDYKTKYLKYKQKYLDLQSDIKFNIVPFTEKKQTGGSKPYDKYILLSCKEFNFLVDNLISEDSVKEGTGIDVKYTIMTPENQLQVKVIEGPTHLTPEGKFNVSAKDADESEVIDQLYRKFLNDIGVNFKNGDGSDNIDILTRYKPDYLRKVYNYETTHYYRGYINWKSYNDNTPDIKMNSSTVEKLRGAKIIYFAYFSFNEPNATSIISQLLFLNSLNHYGVAEINIVLPYFPLGTMERIVGEGEIPTAFALANMLNSIPSGASKNNIYFFDIHALCSRFFFHTNTIPVLITLVPRYITYINTNFPDASNLNVVVFPDDGAKKRFEKLFSGFKTITCGKTRKGEERIIKIETGMNNLTEVGGTDGKLKLKTGKTINMFLIDDLVQTGGTLTESIAGIKKYLLDECQATDAELINSINFETMVTHSIFPPSPAAEPDKVAKFFGTAGLKKLVTSNSRPVRVRELKTQYPDKVQVIDIGPILNNVFTKSGDYKNYVAPYSVN